MPLFETIVDAALFSQRAQQVMLLPVNALSCEFVRRLHTLPGLPGAGARAAVWHSVLAGAAMGNVPGQAPAGPQCPLPPQRVRVICLLTREIAEDNSVILKIDYHNCTSILVQIAGKS